MSDNTGFTTDLLVIGSGAGGLATAVTARLHSLDVIVIEKEDVLGGTSAWSGGILWVPCNPHQAGSGISDSLAAAKEYVRHEAGNFFNEERVDAYLRHAPQMVSFMEQKTQVRFELSTHADYHQHLPGALPTGRALRPIDFDARCLGKRYFKLRPPPRERTMMGMQIGAAHLAHMMNARRSLASSMFIVRRVLSHLRDVAIHGRNMTPTMGNALMARLLASAVDLGIPIMGSCRARELVRDGAVIRGAIVVRDGRESTVVARRGVVLACGGFPHDVARRARLYPHHPTVESHLSCAPPGNVGDGVRMAEAVGAVFEDKVSDPAAWYPTSRAKYPDGSEGNNPHLIERGKPGVIAVTPAGRRFTNEAQNYHDFVKAMLTIEETAPDKAIFFLCDHRAFRRYGLGVVRPFPFPYGGFLRTGYLLRGESLLELAHRAGINAQALSETVSQYNASARKGLDPVFHKGENTYDKGQGDPTHSPNPCVGALERPPFYAVRVLPGDLATFAGLRTDHFARVLDTAGLAIPGLYAVGNDQASVFGGAYPGGGATLGPAMTFGYIAARHAAGLAD